MTTYTHTYNQDGKNIVTKVGVAVVPHGFGSSKVQVKASIVKDKEVQQTPASPARLLTGEVDSHDDNKDGESRDDGPSQNSD